LNFFVLELQEKIDLLQKEVSAAGGAKKMEEKKEIVIVVYAKSKKKVPIFLLPFLFFVHIFLSSLYSIQVLNL
jgi:hypothetical protein